MTDLDRDKVCRATALHVDEDPPATAGQLCDACTRLVRLALDPGHPLGLPLLYVALVTAIEPGRRGLAQKVSASRTSPMPINPQPLVLAQHLVDVVLTWGEIVRDHARLTEPCRPTPTTARSSVVRRLTSTDDQGTTRYFYVAAELARPAERPHDDPTAYLVHAACKTLAAHLPGWLDLPKIPIGRRIPTSQLLDSGQPALDDDTPGHTIAGGALILLEMDGVAAALELLDVRRQARSLLGQTARYDRLPLPCPACDHQTLIWWHGSDQVDCQTCYKYWPHGDYQRLARNIAKRIRERGQSPAEEETPCPS